MSADPRMQDLRDFIKRQWMSKIGEQVLGGRLEEAALMGKVSDDVVQFIEKLIKENATLIQEIVESRIEEPGVERLSFNTNREVSRTMSPVSSISTLASALDNVSITSKTRSRGGKNRKRTEDKAAESSNSSVRTSVTNFEKQGNLLYSYSFSRTDQKLFICCGGWDKSYIPWASYLHIKEGYPDEVKDGLKDSNKNFISKNLRNIAILSNIHWAQFNCADRVRRGLKDLLYFVTNHAPNAKVRIAGLLRKTENSSVILYNTTLMHICNEFSEVTYVDVDSIPCPQKFFGVGLSKELMKALFQEVTL